MCIVICASWEMSGSTIYILWRVKCMLYRLMWGLPKTNASGRRTPFFCSFYHSRLLPSLAFFCIFFISQCSILLDLWMWRRRRKAMQYIFMFRNSEAHAWTSCWVWPWVIIYIAVKESRNDMSERKWDREWSKTKSTKKEGTKGKQQKDWVIIFFTTVDWNNIIINIIFIIN